MPIPTELVGSLPRPMKLQEAYADYDEGDDHLGRAEGRAGRGRRGLDQAPGGDRRADRHRRRAARVELRHLPDHRHARGHRPGRQPRRRRPVLRHLRRRPSPPAAAPDRRPVPLQDVRLGVRREEPGDREQARQAGGDRAVDARCCSIRSRARSTATRASSSSTTCATRARRTSASASPPAPCASRSTSPRAGWPTRTTRATRGPARTCSHEFIDAQQPRHRPLLARGAPNIGIHTCPGGDCDSVHSEEVPYEKLLSKMFDINAGYFLIQCASEEDKEEVYSYRPVQPRRRQRRRAGVLHRRHQPARPERRDARAGPRRAGRRRPSTSRRSALGATDDCGFSPFSRDVKPNHGSPDFARDVAMQKIQARLEGARLASEELGI